MARYKNPDFQRIYDAMLAMAETPGSELYLSGGGQRRGANHRCAFWDGYNGLTTTPAVVPNTMTAVCFQAGKEFARRKRGVVDNPNVRVRISKSRAGHYTVSLRRVPDGTLVYIEDHISSLSRAREIAEQQKALQLTKPAQ